jgi:hypothetical protein
MQFYYLNMFRAPICPSSGVQLINSFRFLVAIPRKPPGLCSAGILGVSTDRRMWQHRSNSVATTSDPCSPQEAQYCTTQAAFQVWPPKSGSYLLIVLLMMGILVLETCWGNKTAYFVASSRFFTFTMCTMHGHMNINVSYHSFGEITRKKLWMYFRNALIFYD